MAAPLHFNWPGRVWISSDLHFNHDSLLEFERVQFQSCYDHNTEIIKRFKKKIKPTDTFLCLGDIGKDCADLIAQIPGYKVLILGNHDTSAKKYYKTMFDEVYDGPLFLNHSIIASHEPVPITGHYFLNIHGHLHTARLDDQEHFLNVSCAMTDFYPVRLDSVYDNMATNFKKLKKEKFLTEWYADKYVFTDKEHFSEVPLFSDGHIVPRARYVLQTIDDRLTERRFHGDLDIATINFDTLKGMRRIPDNMINDLVDAVIDNRIYYVELPQNVKPSADAEKLMDIFGVSKFNDLVGKQMIGLMVDPFREKYFGEKPEYLTPFTIMQVADDRILFRFKNKRNKEVSIKTLLDEFGQYWWLQDSDAQLWFQTKFGEDIGIEL